MKPLISYYGGKQRMSRRIVSLLPEHVCYVEPFAGGAAVFFAKERSRSECLNDVQGHIANLYHVARDRPDELLHLLEHTPYSRREHTKARKIYKTFVFDEERPNIEAAWATVVNFLQSFGKTAHGGWSVYPGLAGPVMPQVWANRIDALPEIFARLRGVSIENVDALDCIRRWDGPTALFYLDPPYINTNCDGMGEYSERDFGALCDTLRTIKGSFLLSTYERDLDLGERVEKHEFAAKMTVYANKDADKDRIEVVYRRSSLDIMARFRAMRRMTI